MTGPEHYRKAEELLDQAAQTDHLGSPVDAEGLRLTEAQHAALIARAQVHATLASAAAEAARLADRYIGDGQHITAWRSAAGTDWRSS